MTDELTILIGAVVELRRVAHAENRQECYDMARDIMDMARERARSAGKPEVAQELAKSGPRRSAVLTTGSLAMVAESFSRGRKVPSQSQANY